MQIIITATLIEEQAFILAKEKGYSETLPNIVDGVDIGQTNPETPYEFLKRVYESMIIEDAQRHFIEVFDRRIKEENEVIREGLKAQVINSITSSVS